MILVRRVFRERRALVLPAVVFLLANVAVLALVVFPLERSVAGLKEVERVVAAGEKRGASYADGFEPPAALVVECGAGSEVEDVEQRVVAVPAPERREHEREVAEREGGVALEQEIGGAVATDDRDRGPPDERAEPQSSNEATRRCVHGDHCDAGLRSGAAE